MKWTNEEDGIVRAMYGAATSREIAARLGRTEPAVRSRCWTLGLKSKASPWSDFEITRLRDAYARTGMPVRLDSLAAELGRGRANICRKARSMGLTDAWRAKLEPEARRPPRVARFSTKEVLAAYQSQRQKERIADHGHPRGALGLKHSEATRRAISARSKAAWANPASGFHHPDRAQELSDRLVARLAAGEMRPKYSRCAGGRRPDLGDVYFRSAWEANYARFLNLMVAQGHVAAWEYEAKTFVFEAIKRGVRAYTPDFLVRRPNGNHEWHEVKGWMDPKSATRLKRMAKYFPEEVVVLIQEGWFKSARRSGLSAAIAGWETRGRR